MFSHSFCVAILKRNQRRRSFLLRNLQTSKILRSMMKNASNLIGQVQKLLKKERVDLDRSSTVRMIHCDYE